VSIADDGGGQAAASAGDVPAAASPSRRRAAVFAAIALAAVAGVVLKIGIDPLLAAGHGLVRLASEPWTRPAPPPKIAEPPRVLPRDALADLPPEMQAALTRAELQAGMPFRYQLSVAPAEICALMAERGLANPGWTALGDGGPHECMSDLVPVPGSKPVAPPVDPDAAAVAEAEGAPPPEAMEPRPSTLFFTARGGDADTLDTIRFKLNLEDPSVDAAGRSLLLERLADLSRPLTWPVPDQVAAAIREHRKLSVFSRGIAVEVHPETVPVKRLNVVLLLGTPAARLPTDRFVEAPALPPEMLPQPEVASEPQLPFFSRGTPPGAE
jgi:hypothetical protein